MIEIGKYNQLRVDRIAKIGAFLDAQTGNTDDDILLPIKQMPTDLKEEDFVEVFIYRDSKDRMIATKQKPYAQVGDLMPLRVTDITKIGAFLDWGLEKELFLPIREQTCKIQKGQKYLVKIYLDKTKRLCASMKIDNDLSTNTSYIPGQSVEGIVYGANARIGIFVAVENKHYGFVPNAENFKELFIGDESSFRVIRIREDGKIDLSTRQLSHKQRLQDADEILERIDNYNGFLPLNDKSEPEKIQKYLGMSKTAFKKALGKLLKDKKVIQDEKGIKIVESVKNYRK